MQPLELLRRVVSGFRKNQGFLLASAVAFNALLSMVPLFAVLLIGLSRFGDQRQLLGLLTDSVEQLLPGRSRAITDQVAGFLAHGAAVGWIGGASLIFFGGVAFSVLDGAMAVIFHHRAERRRHLLLSVVLPYLFILALAAALLVASTVAGALSLLRHDLRFGSEGSLLAAGSGALIWLAGALGLALLLGSLYRVMGRVSVRHALAGGALVTLFWELLRRVIAWYFTRLSMVDVLYGSLATTVVVLLTLEVAALILLLGAQVIAELETAVVRPVQ